MTGPGYLLVNDQKEKGREEAHGWQSGRPAGLRRSIPLPQLLKAYSDLQGLPPGDAAEGFSLRWRHVLRRIKHQPAGLRLELLEGLESDG